MSTPGKGPGKGPPPPASKGEGKGGASYKEKQEQALREQEDRLSAEEGFAGKPLSEHEKIIIEQKGTDQEGGDYAGRQFLPSRGYFACKKCGACLFLAESKFVFCQVWSSFDQAVADSINMTLEEDGRVETSCAKCGGHLGHIFEHPGGKRTNQRQCINDSSIQYIKFDPPAGTQEGGELAIPKAEDKKAPDCGCGG
eukprot:CAMPEP_0206461952 /NCGR_PEP_ID=MMETSP0324_2-20121206/25678_1 /ASSEMBLY_ACC=CAM_ASM_000836 /TAXON_ID=2866 /ORGANISM="Crypthecodinium cohnii, Strain Seligo" /LENGTH=196 /DNA_ID=CAMNT_0053933993 /DNA_START=70 /DNA_END=660 /DNA_ORIENTATION=+